MSVFDDQALHQQSGCLGICNGNGDRQFPISDLQNNNRLIDGGDYLITAADHRKKREIDNMLSQAMESLTFEERQEQQEILHGVDQKVAEEENFIEASLQQLEIQLGKIKSRSVYALAEQMDPEYVRARKFRIMFLRGNRYNVEESAENMLRFFEMKCKLFGLGKLVNDITLGDLEKDDIAALKTGFVQVAGKDSSGRILFLNFPGLRGENMEIKNELRMRFYVLMSALEKEENQLSGFISIVFSVGDMKDRFGGSGLFENAKLSLAIPSYKAAAHFCTDEVKEYLIQLALIKPCSQFSKVMSRIKLHYGSQTECLSQLYTYGIPQDFLPLDPKTQQISLKRHLDWVESRFAMEQQDLSSPKGSTFNNEKQCTINPSANDVLVGIGRQSQNMGNQRLRSLVKGFSQAYDNGNSEGRKELVDSVINSIMQESGGRFLREQQDADGRHVGWKEMRKGQVRNTVSQTFRNSYRRRQKLQSGGPSHKT